MSQKNQENIIKDPEITYEKAIKRIEEIAVILEDNNTSIDDSMALFEEALALISFCDKKLKHIQQKVNILTEDGKETEFIVDEE